MVGCGGWAGSPILSPTPQPSQPLVSPAASPSYHPRSPPCSEREKGRGRGGRGGQGSLGFCLLLNPTVQQTSCLVAPQGHGGPVSPGDVSSQITPSGQWDSVPRYPYFGVLSSGDSVCPSHNTPRQGEPENLPDRTPPLAPARAQQGAQAEPSLQALRDETPTSISGTAEAGSAGPSFPWLSTSSPQ